MTNKPTNPKDRIGIKKASLSVVPAQVLAELGVAMTEGALKYGAFNYREAGVRASVYYDATIRHLFSWWEGEDTDPDSGMSHVIKAIASLTVLRDAMMNNKCEDDRPPAVSKFYPALNDRTAALIDKYSAAGTDKYSVGSADDTGWIKWKGGLPPLSSQTAVEYKLRDGGYFSMRRCGQLEWTHHGRSDDIVAYRVIEP